MHNREQRMCFMDCMAGFLVKSTMLIRYKSISEHFAYNKGTAQIFCWSMLVRRLFNKMGLLIAYIVI